jgi:hypothetical protein
MTTHSARLIVLLAAVIAANVSCGSVVRDGKSPVYLVMDSLLAKRGLSNDPEGGTLMSDVVTKGGIVNDLGTVTLRISPKDIGPTATATTPSLNNEVTINRYRVVYRRADGRKDPGVDVPYAFDGAATGTIPVGGSLKLSFELVRHVAKAESPLFQLRFTNGNTPPVISTITDVTFYGRDQVGNELKVTGSILIDFADFADPS